MVVLPPLLVSVFRGISHFRLSWFFLWDEAGQVFCQGTQDGMESVVHLDLTFFQCTNRESWEIFRAFGAGQIGRTSVMDREVSFSYHLLRDFSFLCGPGNCCILMFGFWDITGDNLGAIYLSFVFWGVNRGRNEASLLLNHHFWTASVSVHILCYFLGPPYFLLFSHFCRNLSDGLVSV